MSRRPPRVGAAAGLEARIVVERPHFTVDVAFDVHPGETVAVMGPSGAGKSTLLQALAGLVPLAGGSVVIGGRVVDRVDAPRVHTSPMDRGVVLLGQEARLFPHLSVRDNVAFGPRAARIQKRAADVDADEWLARVGLPGAGERMPRQLSGGEQQRVAVARALAASPQAVLLDEPLVGLDPETAMAIRGMLRAQLRATTTVAVTHDAADAVALADRVIIVEAGRVTQSGAVRDVVSAPATGFVASLADVNRVPGMASGGRWRGDDARFGAIWLGAADAAGREVLAVDGREVAAVFRPGDVRLQTEGWDDDGGANGWRTVVVSVEPTLAGVRVVTSTCAVDVTASVGDTLRPGDELRAHLDPVAVRFVPIG